MLFRLDLGSAAQRSIRVALELGKADLGQVGKLGADHQDFFLPAWTPGSYLIRDYARHLGEFEAVDAETGCGLPWSKVEKNRYRVQWGGSSRVRLCYAVYAHELSVRTAHVTEDWAYWNGACVHLWPIGGERRPATIRVALPPEWRLYCGGDVTVRDGIAEFHVADLDEAIDTPCLAGRPRVLRFDVDEKPHSIVLAGVGAIDPPPELRTDTEAIVRESAAVFGGSLPYAHYTFLAMFADGGRGGLEHANSSTLLAPRTTFRPRKSYEDFMVLVAHEHFHVWNGKRMRPAEFMEFDYESENYTELLWVIEGFTAYYDDLLCLRAGILGPGRYLEIVAEHVGSLRNMPGRLWQSLSEASFDAWIRFYRPDENTRNSTQNYYSNGALVALLIDAKIRRLSDGERCLDDVVRGLYSSTYLKGRGYRHEDVVRCASEAAGAELSGFVEDLVRAPLDPDFDEALDLRGLRLKQPRNPKLYLGVQFRSDELRIASVARDTPAWIAGLAPDDEILGVAELRATSANWQSVFQLVAQVERPLELLISRRGEILRKSVTPVASTHADLAIVSVARPTAQQLRHRQAWLGSQKITS